MTSYKNNQSSSGNSRIWAGVIILVIGLFLLAGQLNLGHLIPSWVHSWQIIMIVVGLAIGGSSNFKNPASFILIGMGTIFLVQKYFHYNIWKLVFPAAIIVVGLWLLMDKKRCKFPPHGGGPRFREDPDAVEVDYTHYEQKEDGAHEDGYSDAGADTDQQQHSSSFHAADGFAQEQNHGYHRSNRGQSLADEDFLNSTAIFSEEKKIVTSKNLQGGEVVNIFGGTDINLMQADIQGPIVIDIFQLFAGTKIIVPAHWKVHSKVVSIFGEVDDRRFFQETAKTEKKIIHLKGTSIFGGVTIKSM